MKTALQIIQKHFGDDYHSLINVPPSAIEKAMKEYAEQEREKAFMAGMDAQYVRMSRPIVKSDSQFFEEYKQNSPLQ